MSTNESITVGVLEKIMQNDTAVESVAYYQISFRYSARCAYRRCCTHSLASGKSTSAIFAIRFTLLVPSIYSANAYIVISQL